MADIITSGASVITPTLILGYGSTRPGGTKVHPIVARGSADVTLRAAGLRTGRMELGFSGALAEADSRSAENLLATAAVFTLVSSDRSTVQMSFVIPDGGTLTRALDAETRNDWVVSFDWQEVSA